MGKTPRTRIAFDGVKVLEDAADLGWNQSKLAAESKLSVATISRFINGEYQTPHIAKVLAVTLGFSIRRYRVSREKASAA